MTTEPAFNLPASLDAIERDTETIGFSMASDRLTGSLLRALAASKPGGRLLELGTGTGLATAWLLDGMDRSSRLETVDIDPAVVAVARRHLGDDARVQFRVGDGAAFMATLVGRSFDLVFADTWPGKFTDLETTLDLVAEGGFYVVDDLLPAARWEAGHAAKVDAFVSAVNARADFAVSRLDWSTGLLIATKRRPNG